MNIYIHCEIFSREFDSKLLLAILAASKGHEVIISDIESIEKGLNRGILKPGIFHTKSLTPSKAKILRHSAFVKAGCKITSIDEEGGLVISDLEKFTKRRYSNETLEIASAIFTWGKDDYNTLKRIFPKYTSKIYMTGSPRIDLWKHQFYENSINSNLVHSKIPYLLISSNLGLANGTPLFKRIEFLKSAEYHKRDPDLIRVLHEKVIDEYRLTYEFKETIEYLSKSNGNFNIILRPHPTENIEPWKIYLNGLPNVYVIKEGSIDMWLHNSIAVMHNGCTTAYQAIISNKPLITYIPFELKHENKLPNELGHIVSNKQDLLELMNKLLKNNLPETKGNSKKIFDKIYIDEEELSAKKMLKIWENNIDNKDLLKKNNWTLFTLSLKLMKFNGILGKISNIVFKNEFRKNYNRKFPKFKKVEVEQKFKKFKHILGIEKKINCKLLSDRTVLIK